LLRAELTEAVVEVEEVEGSVVVKKNKKDRKDRKALKAQA